MYTLVVITQIIINFFEIIAAIAGIIYLTKYREDNLSRYFVIFLWFTVFVEIVFAWLPVCVYFLDSFSGLKNTIFAKNVWVYNIYDVISYSFYSFFFISLIDNTKVKGIAKLFLILYIGIGIFNLVFPDFFFDADSYPNVIIGTLMLLVIIFYYYFQLLQSDLILNFYKSLPFYVSIGLLVFNLILNPIAIYESYHNKSNPEFVEIYRYILTVTNIFMYTCYTIGFIVCSRKNKSY